MATGTLDELRRVLGALGSVVPVVRSPGGDDSVVVDADADDVLGRAYGSGPEGLVLVRPDGYLRLVPDTADPALLPGYLHDVLGVVPAPAS